MRATRELTSPRTTVDTFLAQAESRGERPFLYFHNESSWRSLSWAEARVIHHRYGDVIDAMYEAARAAHVPSVALAASR